MLVSRNVFGLVTSRAPRRGVVPTVRQGVTCTGVATRYLAQQVGKGLALGYVFRRHR